MDAGITPPPPLTLGGGLAVLRCLVAVLVAGSLLGVAMTTQLDGIIAPVGWPAAMVGAVVIGLPVALFMRRRGWRRIYHAVGVGLGLGLVPWGLLSLPHLGEMAAAVGAGGAVGLVAWGALRLQTLPLRFAPPKIAPFAAVGLAAATVALGFAATYGAGLLIFGPPSSPGSDRTVAAYEVPLASAQDRVQMLVLLRRHAAAEGLHVDAASQAELEDQREAFPGMATTIDAAVWRGAKDNRLEASVSDRLRPGFAWITFFRGEDAELAKRFRDGLMRDVTTRWPRTRPVPVRSDGSIALPVDTPVSLPSGAATRSSFDPALKTVLQEYVSGSALAVDLATRVSVATVDLQSDGTAENLVYLSGRDWCGSGGCTLLVVARSGSSFKVLSGTTITRLPIRVLTTRSHGWSDLGVTVAGGGVAEAYVAKLPFNGSGYARNPTMPPASRAEHVGGSVVIPADAPGELLFP